jgi:predicted dehydrogenase
MTSRVRVGLVGTGVIAQVMHLHYLAELADRYQVAAVCDLDTGSARACAERYGVPAVFTDWRDLLGHPLDAVLVLTSGSHAPIAEVAARAGRHVFAEKPSPLRPYIGHYPLHPRTPLPAEITARLRTDSEERVRAATGEASDLERQVYHGVLLDTLVHELNTVRGLLGEPTRLEYASLAMDCVTVMLRFGSLPVAIHWIDLPGIARYGMEFALYAPDRRVTLTFPSPFLRNEPATLEIQDGTEGSAQAWRTEEVASYESGFKRELEAFHDWIVTGREPVTAGQDGLRDVALCQAIVDCHHRGGPVDDPTGRD